LRSVENLQYRIMENNHTDHVEEGEHIESVPQKTDNTVLLVLVTLVLIAGGMFAMNRLMATKPEAKKADVEVWTPSVKVVPLEEIDYQPVIRAEGKVEAATKTMLISEVAGAIVYLSPMLEKGNEIPEGEILLKLDDFDYKTQLVSLKATLADAELLLEQEKARALQAERDWDKLGRGGSATDLVLRKPQIKSAKARIEAAVAAIEKAERDLVKTVIRAPYTCMVDRKFIDDGAYVNRMGQVAEISSIDEHEVRLPINLNEVGFLDEKRGVGSEVLLEADLGGNAYQWKGKAMRYEGGVDRATFSMVMVVNVKRDPSTKTSAMFALPPKGLFVKASITGKKAGEVFSVPREALREGNTLWVLADKNVLDVVDVEVLRSERDRVLINKPAAGELVKGERIIVSPIAVPAVGMTLKQEVDEELKAGDDLK